VDAVRVVQPFELTACRQYLVAFARPHIYRWHPDPRTYLKLRGIGAVRQGHGNAAPISLPNLLLRRPTFEEIPDLKLPEQMEGLAETIIGHLHRLFVRQWGASPSAVAQTARLQLAKRLLDTTILPIAEIALASGFGSLRRFNAVFADATVAGRGQAITPGDARRWHPQRSSLPRADCAFPTAGMS
jgi:AraC-like DNA-binding protein